MNAHFKTILTMASGIGLLAMCIYFPSFATAVWVGMWILLAIMVFVCIYGAIWCAFQPTIPDAPKVREMVEGDIYNV